MQVVSTAKKHTSFYVSYIEAKDLCYLVVCMIAELTQLDHIHTSGVEEFKGSSY